jgi:hypothetical protein
MILQCCIVTDNAKSFLTRSLYEIKYKQSTHQRRVDLHTGTMHASIIDQDATIVKKKIKCSLLNDFDGRCAIFLITAVIKHSNRIDKRVVCH